MSSKPPAPPHPADTEYFQQGEQSNMITGKSLDYVPLTSLQPPRGYWDKSENFLTSHKNTQKSVIKFFLHLKLLRAIFIFKKGWDWVRRPHLPRLGQNPKIFWPPLRTAPLYSLFQCQLAVCSGLFIGPESDHCLPLLLTDSLTD